MLPACGEVDGQYMCTLCAIKDVADAGACACRLCGAHWADARCREDACYEHRCRGRDLKRRLLLDIILNTINILRSVYVDS